MREKILFKIKFIALQYRIQNKIREKDLRLKMCPLFLL